MKRAVLLGSLLSLACAPSPGDAGADAGALPVDAGEADAGATSLEAFADVGASSEGIAIGTPGTGASVMSVGTMGDRIVQITPDGTTTEFARIDSPVGIAVRADGRLVVCAKHAPADGGAPALFSIDGAGAVSPLVERGPSGETFGLTNFVAIAPDGSLVFTDSMANRVYRADAEGANVALVTDAVTFPNGLSFSPDGTALYVASWDSQTVFTLPFDRASSRYGEPVVSIGGVRNVDGLVTTADGELVLVTSTRGILLGTPGSDTTSALTAMRAIALPANGVFGDAAFGPNALYLSALGQGTITRVMTELSGAPLPSR